jgi:hypothetical protein
LFRLDGEDENWKLTPTDAGGTFAKIYDEEDVPAARVKIPFYELSPGATISPDPKTSHDFFDANGVTFTVTSEDGTASRIYIVQATVGVITGAQCGAAAVWEFDGSTLRISGSGEMYNFRSDVAENDPAYNPPPWHYLAERIDNVIIDEGITYIGEDAFAWHAGGGGYQDHLQSVTLPNTLDSIGDYAFTNCGRLMSINFPASLKVIGRAFEYCHGLTNVVIGNDVTTIRAVAFYNCEGLVSVTIGSSVTKIGGYVFTYCNALRTVINYNPEPQELLDPKYNTTAFAAVDVSEITVQVPASAVSAYKAANVWKDFKAIEAIGN